MLDAVHGKVSDNSVPFVAPLVGDALPFGAAVASFRSNAGEAKVESFRFDAGEAAVESFRFDAGPF